MIHGRPSIPIAVFVAAAAACLLASHGAHAQQPPGGPPGPSPGAGPVQVTAIQGLDLGAVMVGATRELLADQPEAGLFEVEAPADREVLLEFDLPDALAAGGQPAAGQLDFPQVAAAWSEDEDFSDPEPFDPTGQLVVTVPPSGRFYVRLGTILTVDEDAWAGTVSNPATLFAELLRP